MENRGRRTGGWCRPANPGPSGAAGPLTHSCRATRLLMHGGSIPGETKQHGQVAGWRTVNQPGKLRNRRRARGASSCSVPNRSTTTGCRCTGPDSPVPGDTEHPSIYPGGPGRAAEPCRAYCFPRNTPKRQAPRGFDCSAATILLGSAEMARHAPPRLNCHQPSPLGRKEGQGLRSELLQ